MELFLEHKQQGCDKAATCVRELLGRGHVLEVDKWQRREIVHSEDCSEWLAYCRRGDSCWFSAYSLALGNLEYKATRNEESCSEMQRSILLDNKFTMFLKRKDKQSCPVDVKKAKNKEELAMMAKSRIIKTDMKILEIPQRLKHNLLSISQLCDKGLKITFEPKYCLISNRTTDELLLMGKTLNNIYVIKFADNSFDSVVCLLTKEEDAYKRLIHISMNQLNKLVSKKMVNGLPKIRFSTDRLCDACQKGKLTKQPFKSKREMSTKKPLQLLHMDLFKPSRIKSLGGNSYGLVIVDDYSRYTWTYFIAAKNDTLKVFK
ncbi:uncharacterized protein LOC106760306 [Vigna radiata var. radiata]|uniref:Uncharacterized protein LOC106760306 n=1 Tax=Vigna radiata var. radiata TaxID=3916 RepID=A0A1S3TZP7_VIGRR|nr:uncharacterized protein LOC106760306 [Vigna radiata var. radiata]